jgi:hypothetical protein
MQSDIIFDRAIRLAFPGKLKQVGIFLSGIDDFGSIKG